MKKQWGAWTTVVLLCVFFGTAPALESSSAIFLAPADPNAVPANRIDQLVLARLNELGIPPAERCSDAVFIRRVYLDMLGTLPEPRAVTDFLKDANPAKRAALIEKLFDRGEFAEYWAMKWCDILRVKAEFPSNLWPNAVQAYHRWLRDAIRDNMPYDRFVHELLTASGSNFRVPPVNFYRAVKKREPASIAEAVALTWMGQRTDHWPAENLEGMAAFFTLLGYKPTSEWKEEILYFDLPRAIEAHGDGTPLRAVFPDGQAVTLDPSRDPRIVFADWLIRPDNPWFAKNIVNRIWSWLLGYGIIHEPDDVRADNPPRNPALLAYLERELAAGGYDLRHIYRLVLNSDTYQRSSIPHARDTGEAVHFSHYLVRRLEAEVLIDAINRITGSTESYSSQIPEPFTFIPDEHRASTLGDGSITSAFLDMFGRPPRDTGLEFERNNLPSDTQALHLLNSSHIQRKIQQSQQLRRIAQSSAGQPRAIVERLYLIILSRRPSDEEQRIAAAYLADFGGRPVNAAGDIVWALINSKEFLYRH